MFLTLSLTALALALPVLAGRASQPQDERTAVWRAHYERVERELAGADCALLSAEQRAARAKILCALSDYRERGRFGRQDLAPGALLPQFVDREGRRCAVAELLHASGRDDLVARVREAANTAWIADLAGDRPFLAWLDENGLTLCEAARIQTAAFEGPGDTVDPGGDPAAGPARPPHAPHASGPAPAPTPSQPAPAPVRGPVVDGRAIQLDAWWTWWEYNKLAYLRAPGLEGRLARERNWDAARIAAETEPLRRARESLFLAELSSDDAAVRASAALSLGRVARERAVAPLVGRLADPSRRVREHALLGLGASGAPEAARVLTGLLERGGRLANASEVVSPRAVPLAIVALGLGRRAGFDPAVGDVVAREARRVAAAGRERALWAACLFERLAPHPATAELARDLLADGGRTRFVRAAAIEALAATTDPATLARIQTLLTGRDVELRRAAALSLGRSPLALALPALLTAFELESEPVARGYALLSLGALGGPAARDLLLEVFREGPQVLEPWAALGLGLHARASADVAIRGALLEALPRLRNEDSRPAVLLALGLAGEDAVRPVALDTLARAASARERGYAASALALLGPASADALRARLAVERSGFVRATIAQALSTVGAAEDARALLTALEGLADPGLRAVTAAALGLLGATDALPPLELLANGETTPSLVHATAIDGLGLLLVRGEPLVLARLTQAANYAVYEDWVFELFQVAL